MRLFHRKPKCKHDWEEVSRDNLAPHSLGESWEWLQSGGSQARAYMVCKLCGARTHLYIWGRKQSWKVDGVLPADAKELYELRTYWYVSMDY